MKHDLHASGRERLKIAGIAAMLMAFTRIAVGQQEIYTETFDTDGEGTRYTSTGRGFVLDPGAGGSAYWAPNFQVTSGGGEVSIAIPNLGKRAVLAWNHLITAEAVTPQMRTLLSGTIDWLAQGRTPKTVLFSPSFNPDNTGDAYLVDLLTEKGFTVQDDAGPSPVVDASTIAFVITTSGADPDPVTRFLRYPAPMLTYNGPAHDDEATSSIGEADQTFQPTNAVIVTPSHPAAGGLTNGFEIVTSEQPFDTVGSRLPAEAMVIATYKRLTPFVLDSNSEVDDLVAGRLAATSTTGTLAIADIVEDPSDFESAGVWESNLTAPGITGDTPPSFALVGRGELTVSAPGAYTFALGVDDGGRLRIDVNTNGIGPEDLVVSFEGSSAFRTGIKDVTFAKAGTYPFEWVAFDQGGASGAEVSVATAAGSTPEPVGAGAWEVLGQHAAGSPVKLSGPIAVTTYVPNVTESLVDSTLLAVLEPGQRLLGDAISGWQGAGFWAGADMNEPTLGDCCMSVGDPRTLTLNPVDVSGRTNVHLTVALAAADIDFEPDDFLSILIDPDGPGAQGFVELDHFRPKDATEHFFRNLNGGGPRRLGYAFQDFTYDIPAGATQLVLRFEAMSTFFNEMLGIDNVRITSGSTQPANPPDLSIARSGTDLVLTFTGTLESSTTLLPGSWTAVPGNPASPLKIPQAQQTGNVFYRTSR